MAWGEPTPPSMENFVTSPSTMQGFKCYTDASTTPDPMSNGIRPAGIGIFITNTQMQPPLSISLKAVMNDTPSVFVAEAAALAFAISLLHFMQLNPVNFLTDNQLLSHYLNSTGHFDLPDWRAAAYTQIITSSLAGASKVFNISRNHNHMADSLVKEGLHLLQSNSLQSNYSCTDPSHVHGCPLLGALQFVTINSVMVIAAACC
jgi:ribonuclease HI